MDLSYNPAMTKAPMIEAQSLTKWYGAIRAVSDVSFSLAAGEVLGYLGPNGSGKSTTVGMLTGLIEPSGGRVLFHGTDISEDPIEFRRHVGYVPEEPHLYPYLSGVEYLQLVADLRDLDARGDRNRCRVGGVDAAALVRRPRRSFDGPD